MDIVYSKEFIKSAQVIPKHIQRKLADSLEFVKRDPFHLVLHAKPLSGVLKGFYSFRVTRDWRVIFYFRNSQVVFLVEIAHRKDIYK
ncbi:hypothetical protein A2Z10_02910 [Candidatus Azambacteria bacterium RBG_16_47_10]|uniref:Uncharacterized protein n=1 Tax=Candidatus Azambacteria bacterium RBG_16_47_10 TaxID=1797292 RepID=A0A1F5B0S5_9BACT|nr:MAG: hypothetical protein A2Z10_02910 [Candidatus Azambacteria bacterium RBG_16_47_10]